MAVASQPGLGHSRGASGAQPGGVLLSRGPPPARRELLCQGWAGPLPACAREPAPSRGRKAIVLSAS